MDLPPEVVEVQRVQFLPLRALPKRLRKAVDGETPRRAMSVLGQDGTLLLLALTDTAVKALCALQPGAGPVITFSVSPNGSMVATGTAGGALCLHDVPLAITQAMVQAGAGGGRASGILQRLFPGKAQSWRTGRRSSLMPSLRASTSAKDPTAPVLTERSQNGAGSARRPPPAPSVLSWTRTGALPGAGMSRQTRKVKRSARLPSRGDKTPQHPQARGASAEETAKDVEVALQVDDAGAGAGLEEAATFLSAHLRNKVAVGMLHGRGQGLTDACRKAAWRFALRLPNNGTACEAAGKLPLPPGLAAQVASTPLSSPRLDRNLRRALATLVHWCPELGSLQYLPTLAFPFVRFWGADPTAASETLIMVWTTWARGWLETAPLPPSGLLGSMFAALQATDPELAQHMARCGADGTVCFWPMLRSVLSEVLPKESWCVIWDTLMVHAADPSLLPLAVLAVVLLSRSSLLAIKPAPHAPDTVLGPPPVQPACEATQRVAAALRRHLPHAPRDILRKVWELRTGLPAHSLRGLSHIASSTSLPGAAADTAPTAHAAASRQVRKDGVALHAVTVQRPARGDGPASPFPAPGPGKQRLWLPHPDTALPAHPSYRIPKSPQALPSVPPGVMPMSRVNHAHHTWTAIAEAEAETLRRKRAAEEMSKAAAEAEDAARADKAAAEAHRAGRAQHQTALAEADKQGAEWMRRVTQQAAMTRAAALTRLHRAASSAMMAREATAKAAASGAAQQAADARSSWQAFAQSSLEHEAVETAAFTAQTALTEQARTSAAALSQAAQEHARDQAARVRQLKQVALGHQMRSEDEARRAARSRLHEAAQAEGAAAAAKAVTTARALSAQVEELTAKVSMAAVQRERAVRHAVEDAEAAKARRAAWVQGRSAALEETPRGPVRDLLREEAELLGLDPYLATEVSLQAARKAAAESAADAARSRAEDMQHHAEGDTRANLARLQGDLQGSDAVDAAVESAVWRSAAALDSRPAPSVGSTPAASPPPNVSSVSSTEEEGEEDWFARATVAREQGRLLPESGPQMAAPATWEVHDELSESSEEGLSFGIVEGGEAVDEAELADEAEATAAMADMLARVTMSGRGQEEVHVVPSTAPQTQEWLDTDSSASESPADGTFAYLVAGSLSPVPEDMAKSYGATFSPLDAKQQPRFSGHRHAPVRSALSIENVEVDSPGSFGGMTEEAGGVLASGQLSPEAEGGSSGVEQKDVLSGRVGGGSVVYEHNVRVRSAVRAAESGRVPPGGVERQG